MRYFKNTNNEIYAYEDNVNNEFLNQKIKELGLISISDNQVTRILKSKENTSRDELSALLSEIYELEQYINQALLIGNESVLKELREEYKEKLTQKEILTKG